MRWAATLLFLAACSRHDAAPTPTPPPPPLGSTVPAPSPAPASTDPPGFYLGRRIAEPMSYRGADWLERPNRDEEQKPEHVLDVLGVQAGQTVADVGCGSGYFTEHLSHRVGATGRVFATDLQQEMLDLLGKRITTDKLSNVAPKLATPDDAALPAGQLDLILLVDVYHELPKPPVSLAQFKRALKPSGKLALVEYRGEDPNVPIKPEHKTTLEQLKRELAANQWTFAASDESLPQQRIVTFTP